MFTLKKKREDNSVNVYLLFKPCNFFFTCECIFFIHVVNLLTKLTKLKAGLFYLFFSLSDSKTASDKTQVLLFPVSCTYALNFIFHLFILVLFSMLYDQCPTYKPLFHLFSNKTNRNTWPHAWPYSNSNTQRKYWF